MHRIKGVSLLKYNGSLILISVIIVFVLYFYESKVVSLRYSDELQKATEHKVVNHLLIELKQSGNSEKFIDNYFKPMISIEVFKALQFVSDRDGRIMDSGSVAHETGTDFDFRKRDWYQCAKLLASTRDFCISDPYEDYWPPHKMTITYSYPIYGDTKLLGVGLHDLYLENLYEWLFLIEFKSVSLEGGLISDINISNTFAFFLFSYALSLLTCSTFSAFNRIACDYLFKDELTGLPTRRSFKYFPFTSSTKAICIIDIDYFKQINDTYGHDAGDRCLSEISILMKNNIRKADNLYRWGGEEFLLLISGDDVECVLDRLRTEIANNKFKSVPRTVTVTIGFKCYEYGNDIIDIIKKADRALYKGKNEGRNRVIKY